MKKLVRDKIIQIIKQDGKKPNYYVAENNEYFKRLKEKLLEEVNEYLEENNFEELVDIIEIVYALAKFQNFNNLEEMRIEKQNKRGSFNNKHILVIEK
ncbi:nucleoside triphosphate pyrophosphohydrolase [archaeon]|jgi:predicted house-cleaning noncanonical NTP pyrophosphatase (MazG superfamily)|nr:nucleoside triphosphate pyrophosphohydrolase [archaeon]MBT4022946.1 nucleoside triphosphate pyrophosphohydrolase [archaeon]MBT4271937.1 nucleoside triphosphate pyrophosphohydrolase [archaeon]MBT4461775.1 nucleoside triphosphate pyrophosphohydrolase [archaeon]MBT5424095.1 nucleoside triphosphate pyrophosphohydrolase [archaeon]